MGDYERQIHRRVVDDADFDLKWSDKDGFFSRKTFESVVAAAQYYRGETEVERDQSGSKDEQIAELQDALDQANTELEGVREALGISKIESDSLQDRVTRLSEVSERRLELLQEVYGAYDNSDLRMLNITVDGQKPSWLTDLFQLASVIENKVGIEVDGKR